MLNVFLQIPCISPHTVFLTFPRTPICYVVINRHKTKEVNVFGPTKQFAYVLIAFVNMCLCVCCVYIPLRKYCRSVWVCDV